MPFTTTAEFELEGAGLDAQIEVEIKYEVYVPGKGYDDEESVTGYEVTRFRHARTGPADAGKPWTDWHKPDTFTANLLAACVDDEWLLEQHEDEGPDDDDRGDYLRDLRDDDRRTSEFV